MLEQIDFKAPHMDKAEAKKERERLEKELTLLQQRAVAAKVPLVLVVEGWETAGKGTRINELITNLDARATTVHVINDPVGYEARLPFMARFWQRLGKRGQITIFDQSWYNAALHKLFEETGIKEILAKKDGKKETEIRFLPRKLTGLFSSIEVFERQLTDDGYVIVKLFLHISKKEQAKRIEELLSDPTTAWRVREEHRLQQEHYENFALGMDLLLSATNKPHAPWIVLNGEDRRGTRVEILRAVVGMLKPAVEAAEARIAAKEQAKAVEEAVASAAVPEAFTGYSPELVDVSDDDEYDEATSELSEREAPAEELGLSGIERLAPGTPVGGGTADDIVSRFKLVKVPSLDDTDHTLALSEEEYRTRLAELQERISTLHQRAYLAKLPIMIAYEGWDAAGKGGNIKRLARALDARGYHVIPSPAPTPDELAHPHLWRYWTRLPRTGHVAIYDRTWYGRVLVERVEGFASTAEWRRAYDEINEFEEDMRRAGVLLLKFWIDVSSDEQLRRFHDRQADPEKQWKIVPDDWRNRGKNPQYFVAIQDMLRLTSTTYAPWHVIEGDDKRYARIKVLEIVADAIEERLAQMEEEQ